MAWIDLLLLANHKPATIVKRGIRVKVQRGDVGLGIRTLADRWKWSTGKVTRFLKALQDSNQIVTANSNIGGCITIVNYDRYQTSETQTKQKRDADETPEDQPGDPGKKVKNLTWFRANKDEVIAEITKRFPNKDAEACYNYFLSKMDAKNYGYKNYLLALCNWIKDDKFNNFPNKKKLSTYVPDERDKW